MNSAVLPVPSAGGWQRRLSDLLYTRRGILLLALLAPPTSHRFIRSGQVIGAQDGQEGLTQDPKEETMTATPFPSDLLIDGQFQRGEGEAEKVLNPATGELLIALPEASADQVHRAVLAAHRAFEHWCETTPMERSRMLLRLADASESRASVFARLESLNCGKPYARALADEIPAIVDCFRYFAGAARCVSGTVANEYLAGHTSMIRRDPVGVVGSIAPWNYPLLMAAWKTAPALAAGNTVVPREVRVKSSLPSSDSRSSMLLVSALCAMLSMREAEATDPLSATAMK